MIDLQVTSVCVQYVFQRRNCFTVLDFTTVCTVHVGMYYIYCTSLFPNFALQSAVHRLRVNQTACQQRENCAAAQPVIGIELHTQKQFRVKLWL